MTTIKNFGKKAPVKIDVLGVQITNATAKDVLKYVVDFINVESGKLMIVTPNPEIVVYARKHDAFRKILNNAEISLADGVGIGFASLLLREKVLERITGVDFMLELCDFVSNGPISIGLLGAQAGVAERTRDCLLKNYPNLNISFVGEEWAKAGEESPLIDILFVAFGFPKQEEWIAKNLEHIPVKVAMGVGGAFDYISGNVSRAPFLIRAIGFEWLYRLIGQPWRWRRQVSLARFVYLVLRERMGNL